MNKQGIIKRLTKDEDKLFISKVIDKIERCEKTGQVIHTDFMDPYQRSLVETHIGEPFKINLFIWGGFEGAERTVLFICPEFIDPMELEWEEYFQAFHIPLRGWGKLTHRDYLGSLMGLGIKREKTGDILVNDEGAKLVVLDEISDFVYYYFTQVARQKVNPEKISLDSLEIDLGDKKEISVSLASLRLDCVASAGFGISRSKLTQLIKAEKINLNWETVDNPSKLVKEGDTISMRGKGRLVLESIGNTSRKGRVFVSISRMK